MIFRKFFNKINGLIKAISLQPLNSEEHKIMLGKLLTEKISCKKDINSLHDVEFKVFSQWGDDGIIQWLVNNIEIPNKCFIEFGVENYIESNTRFLLMNNNWSGLIMDADPKKIDQIKESYYYWKYDISAKSVFIDTGNINDLLSSAHFGKEIGVLHIDIDGNDYWVWKEINSVSPIIVILEYNSVFGADRLITIPYSKNFRRSEAHYSHLYYGASIRALCKLSSEKGYAFIGCNSAGNNAYFIRKDKLNDQVKEIPVEKGYVYSKFRESRDRKGRLTHLIGKDRIDIIKGLPAFNVETGQVEDI